MKRRGKIATRSKAAQPLPKLATGIEGFDELSGGGLPRHRTSLLIGGPGAGKTVFALQCLVNAVRRRGSARKRSRSRNIGVREAEESSRRTRQRPQFKQKRRELEFAEATTSAQVKVLQLDLERQRAELALYSGENEVRSVSSSERENELRRRRSADPADLVSHKGGNGATK